MTVLSGGSSAWMFLLVESRGLVLKRVLWARVPGLMALARMDSANL